MEATAPPGGDNGALLRMMMLLTGRRRPGVAATGQSQGRQTQNRASPDPQPFHLKPQEQLQSFSIATPPPPSTLFPSRVLCGPRLCWPRYTHFIIH
ncbi:uncharacterized protein N7459_003333 [Penicillium hispanicum]|uniref:uncharacterized protein n=1 Tax=Penicillium hispanicum TaxID=1080232 RepID=UPI0025410723|nr:uncharacterized protein N7459_003333 [Penicillium hispanicum]KAJ5587568.1 hypothetical protein N7459_003333 [Penicillium hispanicum]